MAIKKSRKGGAKPQKLYIVPSTDGAIAHYGYDRRTAAKIAQDLHIPRAQHLPI